MPISYRTNLLPPSPRKAPSAPRVECGDPKARLLSILTAAANEGRQCPSTRELAEAIGRRSASSAASFLLGMAKKGVILIERYQTAYVVTIVATGRSTAMPENTQPHWRASHKAQIA